MSRLVRTNNPPASPAPRKRWTLTQEGFDRLLGWLDADRERAGQIYEEIRAGLLRGFEAHGCKASEELADLTINRVAQKLPEIIDDYVGPPAPYFYRVAHYVHLEYLRREPETTPLHEGTPAQLGAEDVEQVYACLEKCVKQLPRRSRDIITQYYQGEKRVKIELRRELARRFNIELPILRLQAHRIRNGLKDCIIECLRRKVSS